MDQKKVSIPLALGLRGEFAIARGLMGFVGHMSSSERITFGHDNRGDNHSTATTKYTEQPHLYRF
jgi:hypothetical protein